MLSAVPLALPDLAHHGLSCARHQRLGGIDPCPKCIDCAVSGLKFAKGSPASSPVQRRGNLLVDVFHGRVEVYNDELEGYEAHACLDVIQHLNPTVLSRIEVVLMGTYRPRLMLVTMTVSRIIASETRDTTSI